MSMFKIFQEFYDGRRYKNTKTEAYHIYTQAYFIKTLYYEEQFPLKMKKFDIIHVMEKSP